MKYGLPMLVNGEDDLTIEAWAVFRTAPHVAWHISNLYADEVSAREAVKKLCHFGDGIVIRRIHLEPAVLREEER